MKLQNTIPHMAGQSVRVNGTSYQLDAKGVVNVIDEKDIAKLLADRTAWRVYVDRSPIVNPVVTPAPVTVPTPLAAPIEESPEDAIPPDEWPDPDVSMTTKQLHEIADAYRVPYTSKTSKKALVDLIMVAMYGEE